MKNLILGFALVGLALGCKSDKNTSVSDPAAANMPKSECCASKKGECSEAEKAECMKKCSAKSEAPQN